MTVVLDNPETLETAAPELLKPFSYHGSVVPESYKCATCSKQGVKLWLHGHHRRPQLMCGTCEGMRLSVEIASGGNTGCAPNVTHADKSWAKYDTPAIPIEATPDRFSAWEDVTTLGRMWWSRLPL